MRGAAQHLKRLLARAFVTAPLVSEENGMRNQEAQPPSEFDPGDQFIHLSSALNCMPRRVAANF
jgi:hypothetical protein